ncbi:hypothetical protein ACTD5D_41165 [Nocardia takedensis]|uniref:hypothetical protein n=1 Tax=Nocardia takedensis TaxID=259390 RepID=UPI003F7727C5
MTVLDLAEMRTPRPRKRLLMARDQRFVEWAVQQYGASIDLVSEWYGVGRSWTHEIVSALVASGKVETTYADAGTEPRGRFGPLWVIPTRATAHAILGTDPGPWTVRPSTAAHVRAVARLRLRLTGRTTSTESWWSERLLAREITAKGGQQIGNRPYIHDGVFCDSRGKYWAVEAELSAKRGAGRMEATLKTSLAAMSVAGNAIGAPLSGVIYFCGSPQIRAHVERAKQSLIETEGPDAVRGLHIRDLSAVLDDTKREATS